MEPRIHVLTLAVEDLERALAFYRALGFESPGIVGTEFARDAPHPGGAVAMFDLRGGLILSLYSRTDLALDAGIPAGPASPGSFSIGHLVASRDDVDAVLREAAAAGATLIGHPHERPWGIYSGYFSDPDGHIWEVIWNPEAKPDRGS